VGDTIEAIPKLYASYTSSPTSGYTDCRLVVRPTPLIPFLFGLFHYWHLYRLYPGPNRPLDPVGEFEKLFARYKKGLARGGFLSYLLPGPQREWSHAKIFLAHWGYRSIPPQIDFLEPN